MREIFNFLRRGYGLLFLGCVLLVGTAVIVILPAGDQLRYPDEVEYDALARHLRAGDGFVDKHLQPSAKRPPAYPYFLAGLYSLQERPLTAKLANAVMLGFIGWMLARIVGNARPAAWVAASVAPWLLLLYPVFVYTASTLYPQIAGTLLLVVAVYGIGRFPRSRMCALLCGIIYGLLILAIPAFLLTVPIIMGFIVFANRRALGRAIQAAALFGALTILVVSPWTIRNYRTFHRVIAVSANSGINLLLGNSENTRPNSGINVDIKRYLDEALPLPEVERDVLYKRRAVEWITGHPGEAMRLYVLKVVNYFNYRNQLATHSETSAARDMIVLLSYYPLLLAAFARLMLWRRYPLSFTEWLCYCLYFSGAFTNAIFFTRIRFRLPFDALLIACVAIFIGHLWSSWRARCSIAEKPITTGFGP